MKYLSMFSGIGGFEKGIEQAYEKAKVRNGDSGIAPQIPLSEERSEDVGGSGQGYNEAGCDFGYGGQPPEIRNYEGAGQDNESDVEQYELEYETADSGCRYGMEPGRDGELSGDNTRPEQPEAQGGRWDSDKGKVRNGDSAIPSSSCRTYPKFVCVGYSEIDRYASSIYRKHYPEHRNFGDATTIDVSELPDFDLLVGGFPCQAFSHAGKRQGFLDARGTLFFEIARVLQHKRPRYFLLENVEGLLSHDDRRTFVSITRVLSDIGYRVSWQVLNTKDYGLPQNRERIFIAGCFGGKCGPEVFPIAETNQIHYGESGEDQFVNCGEPRITDIMPTLGENDYKEPKQVLINKSIRRLTPVECERLQGFPDGWTKCGINEKGKKIEISDTQRYKCLGNAVSVNVIEKIISKWFL